MLKKSFAQSKKLGFEKNAVRNGRKRFIDFFNQGIDIRLINPSIARLLGETAISPVRVAFDSISVEKVTVGVSRCLQKKALKTLRCMLCLTSRILHKTFIAVSKINIELSEKYSIRISGFPMRYCPIDDIDSASLRFRKLELAIFARYPMYTKCNSWHRFTKKESSNLSFGESF